MGGHKFFSIIPKNKMKKHPSNKKDDQLYKDKNDERVKEKAPDGKAGIAATEEERANQEKEKKEESVDRKNQEATD